MKRVLLLIAVIFFMTASFAQMNDDVTLTVIGTGETEEIATQRFDTYYEQTAPLIEYYRGKGVLRTINAQGTINEVWERLLEAVS